jgi:anti-sigma factor RsiW
MTCQEIRPALDAIADGELAREEERVLRAHLDGCPACARDLAERRIFSDSLRRSFDRVLDVAEPPPGTRERLAERLHGASRRRLAVPARLAAVLVFGLAVGLGAWAVGMSRPTRLQVELAGRIRDGELNRARIGALTQEIGLDLEQALRVVPAADPQDSTALVVKQGAVVIESRMAEPSVKGTAQLVADTASRDPGVRSSARSALRRLEPSRLEELRCAAKEAPMQDVAFVEQVLAELEDRAQPSERRTIEISKSVNGVTVAFSQLGDGRVRLAVPGRTLESRSMEDLLRQHPDVCAQYRVAGRDGFVTIDGSNAAVDLRGQLDLLFRTGRWTDEVQWDAYRAWASGKTPDPKQVEARVKEMQERCRRQYAQLPELRVEVRIDIEQILKDVKAMTRQQLESTNARVEQEMRALDLRLKDLHELRARAKGLRVYAEDAKKVK